MTPSAYPHPSSPAATAVMKGNTRRDTKPEAMVRSLLHRRGLRFRKDHRVTADGVRTYPDIVFTRWRLAVYIDGCFWHRCPHHGTTPTSNVEYWVPKLERNVQRDRTATHALRRAGWTVLRYWEHVNAERVADEVVKTYYSLAGTVQDGQSRD